MEHLKRLLNLLFTKKNYVNNYLSIVIGLKSYSLKELIEWLLWHKFIGVDHFYIFDDNSSVSVKRALEN